MGDLAKQIEEKSKEKDKFFACVSHELRNPLNSLLATIEILPKAQPAKQGELISAAKSCGDTLLHLIGNILDVSKINDKKMEVYFSDSDISEIINRVMVMHKMKAEKKGLFINMFRDKNIPPCVKIDTAKIIQVLTNLISNSIKFTDKGLVVTKLTWFPITKDNYSTKDFEKEMEEALNNSSRDEIINSVDENLGSRMLSNVHKKLKKYKGKPRRSAETDWIYETCEIDTSPGPWLKYGKGIILDRKSTYQVRIIYIYIYIYIACPKKYA